MTVAKRIGHFLLLAIAAIILVGLVMAVAQGADPAPPALTVQAASGGGAVLASDSTRAWKRTLIVAGTQSGTYTLVQAEHGSGEDGGIWQYTITIALAGSAPAPSPSPGPGPEPTPAPNPQILPLETLRQASADSFRAAALPAAEARQIAGLYEGLARDVESGAVVSPAQLSLATQVQFTALLTVDRQLAWRPWRNAVGQWLDTQQAAGLLSASNMPGYAQAYRTAAEALRSALPSAKPTHLRR